jgi:phage gpG-like protein
MPVNFRKIQSELNSLIANKFTQIVKREALSHYDSSFRSGGFTNSTFIPWRKRTGERSVFAGGLRLKFDRKAKESRAVLVKSGALRRSIKAQISPGIVRFWSDLPYAKIHNEGGTINRAAMSRLYVQNRISKGKNKGRYKKGTTQGRGSTVKAYRINMPRRQFMGESRVLTKSLENQFRSDIMKLFN